MTNEAGTNTVYVIDAEQPAETARVFEQSKLFTRAMGGLFPDELDLSGVRRVLDLGCGPGQWAGDVAFEYPEWKVVGVDINATMIGYAHAVARSQGRPNLSFEVMDIKQPLTFPDASFELINVRFIVGFQDTTSWPVLLAECRRVLAPGGLLLLTEAERSISTSPALQRLESWLTHALCEQGRTFSVDGQTIGIVHMLGRLLQQTGFVGIEQCPFVLDASYDSPLYASSFREFEVTYALLQPYLVGSGVVDAASYDRCYHWMLAETRHADFRCLAFGLSAWGRKPNELVDEGMKDIP